MNQLIIKALWAMALMLVPLSFVACSDDDDDDGAGSAIVGTWSYDDDEFGIGTFAFNSNGSVVWKYWDDEENAYETTTDNSYELNGETLKVVFGYDDYTLGTVSFSSEGNTAIYTYKWYDYDGEWEGEETYTLTLQKQ